MLMEQDCKCKIFMLSLILILKQQFIEYRNEKHQRNKH